MIGCSKKKLKLRISKLACEKVELFLSFFNICIDYLGVELEFLGFFQNVRIKRKRRPFLGKFCFHLWSLLVFILF
jgi:hypothetical protein